MTMGEAVGLGIVSFCTFLLGVMLYRDWKDELLRLFRWERRGLVEVMNYRVTGPTEIELDVAGPGFPCPSCGGQLRDVDHEVVDWECLRCLANSEEPYSNEERPVWSDSDAAVRKANQLADAAGMTRAQRAGMENEIRRAIRGRGTIDEDGLLDVLHLSRRMICRQAEDTVVLVTERNPVRDDASWADVMIRYVRGSSPEVYVAGTEGEWCRDENDTRRIGICLENAVVVMNVVQHRGIGQLMRELDPHLTVDHWHDIPVSIRNKVDALPMDVRVELIRTLKMQDLYERRDKQLTERDLQL